MNVHIIGGLFTVATLYIFYGQHALPGFTHFLISVV